MSFRHQIERVQVDYKMENRSWKDETDLCQWLQSEAARLDLEYVLAHAVDGVIWGRFSPSLEFSSPYTAGPALRLDRLEQFRAFGERAEWLVWRSWDGFRARLACEGAGAERPTYLEGQILWGTAATPCTGGRFTLLSESQGLRHAVPISIAGGTDRGGDRRLTRLVVRHYCEMREPDHIWRVALSRLVAVEAEAQFQQRMKSHVAA